MTLLPRRPARAHVPFDDATATCRSSARRDCYSRPEAVYATAKARGMDLVAITDHDTIDGALALLERIPTRATSSSARRCRAGCRMATSRCISACTG